MFRDQRGQALHVVIGNTGTAAAELGERGVQVAGVPQDDGVQDQAQGAVLGREVRSLGACLTESVTYLRLARLDSSEHSLTLSNLGPLPCSTGSLYTQ